MIRDKITEQLPEFESSDQMIGPPENEENNKIPNMKQQINTPEMQKTQEVLDVADFIQTQYVNFQDVEEKFQTDSKESSPEIVEETVMVEIEDSPIEIQIQEVSDEKVIAPL